MVCAERKGALLEKLNPPSTLYPERNNTSIWSCAVYAMTGATAPEDRDADLIWLIDENHYVETGRPCIGVTRDGNI